MNNHLGDTNKMVDTPRADAHIEGLRRNPQVSGCDSTLDFSRQLERELNAAHVEIEEKRKDIVYLATEKAKLENRIHRAAMAFFRDGSDGQVASQMLQILEEERRKQ